VSSLAICPHIESCATCPGIEATAVVVDGIYTNVL